ncbi:MAG: ABC transporter ATP-binding protein [Sphingobium sp.]
MDNAPPALRFDGIVKSYGGAPVLRGIDLAISRGGFVALVGQSGSGKTTLLKCVNQLVEPDAGRVLLEGEDGAALPPAILRRRIGYVFQGTGLFPHMSVGENIAIALRLTGVAEVERIARARDLLDLVGLPMDYADRMPAQLSGGQAQRVGVARALAARPSIMLLDEPFGALDPVTRDTLGRAYRDLHDRLGLTTVMVTHDMAEALLLADRIVVLRDGVIVADAPPADLLAHASDPEVAALVAIPMEQARRLAALRDGAA